MLMVFLYRHTFVRSCQLPKHPRKTAGDKFGRWQILQIQMCKSQALQVY